MLTSDFLKPVHLLCYMAKGIKISDAINVTSQVILKWEDYPALYWWAQSNDPSP